MLTAIILLNAKREVINEMAQKLLELGGVSEVCSKYDIERMFSIGMEE